MKEGDSLVLCNWKSHLIILALRSMIVIEDGTTVLFLCDGLFVLLSVVWSENDNTLTLSNAQSEIFVVEELDDGTERSNWHWSGWYSQSW